MKYPEKERIYDIYSETENGRITYKVRAIGSRFEYICKTYNEAVAVRKKLMTVRVLDSDELNKHEFMKYYGCGICADVLTNEFESGIPLIDASTKARFCPHHECPYAEVIEKYGGYDGYEKHLDGLNYSFIDFAQGVGYFED